MHHNFIDEYSDRDSFLHQRDPRCKIIIFLVFLFLVLRLSPGSLCGFAGYGLLLSALVLLSGLPLSAILRRILTVLPFVFLTAWSMFSVSGKPAGPAFLSIILKSFYALVAVFLLVSTTAFPSLLKALEWLRCPTIMIRMLAFLYRYIYLFLDEFMKMRQAQASRTAARPKTAKALQAFSSILAHLFVRSYEKGERVYQAMCSRGYNGSVPGISRLRAQRSDYIFCAASFASFILMEALCRSL
ncbi:MAG: cobalt ECF transporter T component CbiQ [Candidatus Omnitrophota bacterium]